jgi:hypothetical protein
MTQVMNISKFATIRRRAIFFVVALLPAVR